MYLSSNVYKIFRQNSAALLVFILNFLSFRKVLVVNFFFLTVDDNQALSLYRKGSLGEGEVEMGV